MALNFENLEDQTRRFLQEELLIDIERKSLYLSKRLNDTGLAKYPELLRQAMKIGNDFTLARELQSGCMNLNEQRRKPKGGYTIVKVPDNANETLAEGEFNRFYVRALCRRAIEEKRQLIIYRAKSVTNPRSESEIKIGQTVNPEKLLEDLRSNIGVDTALGVPAGPNSALSVKLA